MQMAGLRVKDEASHDIDWRKEGDGVRQIRLIGILSLPTLQRLYLKYFQEDASHCTDAALLARKLQYWFQRKYYRYHQKPMSIELSRKCNQVIALPITQEGYMKKSALKAKAVEEEVEEVEEAEAAEEEAEKETKRKAPTKTGEPKVIKLKGVKFHAKFIYEALVAMFKANRKLKATDAEFAESIRKAWAGTGINYENYRVNADRKKYNAGQFRGQTGEPEKKSVEYDAKGNVVTRVIPKQLKKYVVPGQPVAKTIAENRKKGLIPAKSAKVTLKNEDEAPKKGKHAKAEEEEE